MPFVKWMDIEDTMLSEIGQTQKNKYHMTSLTHGIQKKKNHHQIYRYTEQKQTGGCQSSEFEGSVGEMGKGRQKIQKE